MSVLKRAFLYITRKYSRNLILLLILTAMSLLMLAGLSIRARAQEAAGDVRKSMTTGFAVEGLPVAGEKVFTLYTNDKGELVRRPKVKLLTKDGVDRVLALDGVKGCFGGEGTETLYTGLNVVPGGYSQGWEQRLAQEGEAEPQADGIENGLLSDESNAKSNNFLGVDDSEWHPFFMNGALELVSGRHIRSGDRREAVISDELAERNGLSLGDTVTGRQFDFVTGERYSSPYEVEIVGLFHVNFEQDMSRWTAEPDILANCIFTDPGVRRWGMAEYKKHYGGQPVVDEEPLYNGAVFYVEDPAQLESVMEQVQAMDIVDWDYFTVERKDDDYQTSAGPIQTTADLSGGLVFIVGFGCLAILSILSAMWIRGRRHEIGILLSVGVTAKMIRLQLLLECALVALAAFLIAGLAAGPLTAALGNAAARAVGPSGGAQPFSVSIEPGTSKIQVFKTAGEPIALSYGIAPGEFLAVFLILLGIVGVAVLLSSRLVTRLKPREILGRR